jgi:hypothetical protein
LGGAEVVGVVVVVMVVVVVWVVWVVVWVYGGVRGRGGVWGGRDGGGWDGARVWVHAG